MADAEQLEQFIEEVTTSQNYISELDEGKVSEIYKTAISEYEIDKTSMSDWLKGMRRGLGLASMMKTAKTYPFSNASNVKYPLIATAALQFNARAYPAIAPGDMPVKTKVLPVNVCLTFSTGSIAKYFSNSSTSCKFLLSLK